MSDTQEASTPRLAWLNNRRWEDEIDLPRDSDAEATMNARPLTDWRGEAIIRSVPRASLLGESQHSRVAARIVARVKARKTQTSKPPATRARYSVSVEQILSVADTGLPISYVGEAIPCSTSTARSKLRKAGKLAEYHERKRAADRKRAEGLEHD